MVERFVVLGMFIVLLISCESVQDQTGIPLPQFSFATSSGEISADDFAVGVHIICRLGSTAEYAAMERALNNFFEINDQIDYKVYLLSSSEPRQKAFWDEQIIITELEKLLTDAYGEFLLLLVVDGMGLRSISSEIIDPGAICAGLHESLEPGGIELHEFLMSNRPDEYFSLDILGCNNNSNHVHVYIDNLSQKCQGEYVIKKIDSLFYDHDVDFQLGDSVGKAERISIKNNFLSGNELISLSDEQRAAWLSLNRDNYGIRSNFILECRSGKLTSRYLTCSQVH